MPSKPLSRTLIDTLKCQRSSTDYLEIDSLDPEESDFTTLGQLLNEALQQPASLTVLELTGLKQDAAKVIATALKNPQCQLQALVLKRMEKVAVAEIVSALRAVPARRMVVTAAGLTESSSHALYISLSVTPHYQFQCTDRSHDWLQRADLVDLLAPLAPKPLMDFSLLRPAEHTHRSHPASPSGFARTTSTSPWAEEATPNTRARGLAQLSLNDEEDCIDLSRQVHGYSPITPGSTQFIHSPALCSSLNMGRPPFSSPGSPQAGTFHTLRAWLRPSSDRASMSRYASSDGPLPLANSPHALPCPPSSPNVEPLVLTPVPSPPKTHVDSPARTLLAFMPTVAQRQSLFVPASVKLTPRGPSHGTP